MTGKRLYRSNRNKILCGVCGGIAEYAGMDPTLIRLIFVLLCFAVGGGLLIYLIAAIIMPKIRKSKTVMQASDCEPMGL